MIKIPFEQIIEKIKEKTGFTDEHINKLIDEKMEELSGLISKDGAAHIIANQYGVKLFDEEGRVKIGKLLPGMRNIEVVGKVTQVWEIREFQRESGAGKVGSFLMADDTGSIRVVCWHDKTEILEKLKTDDIIKIKLGCVKENRGFKEFHLNERSETTINPPDEKIDEIKITQKAVERKKITELAPGDNYVEVLGTIVQAFDPNFFEVCPECGKRIRQKEDSYTCEQHGKVDPDYSYVMNLIVDDGTDTLRTVFFRQMLEKLLSKSPEEILVYRENMTAFEDIKYYLIGQMVKITGRVNKNEMFDRLEFMINDVVLNPDPKEEIERLNKELEQVQTNEEKNQD